MRTSGESFKRNISRNLKKMLDESPVTEAVLSEKTGVSRSALSRIKNGHVCPDVAQASAIAAFFNITVDDFLSDTLNSGEKHSFDSYAPVFKLSENNDIQIAGGIDISDFTNIDSNIIGFSGGKGFGSSLIGKDSVIIIESKASPSEGDMCLVLHESTFFIANFFEDWYSKVENPLSKFHVENTVFIGSVLRIEKSFIPQRSFTDRLVKYFGGMDALKKKYAKTIFNV